MEKKKTFYFSHDYNPRSDQKIKNLLRVHGMTGYGVYWALIEDLYNNTNVLRAYYDSISYDLRISPDLAKSVVEDFELFVIDNGFFSSPSVQKRLDEMLKTSEKAKNAINKRWNKYDRNTTVLPTEYDSNTIKEKKGKEKKEERDISSLWISTLGRNPKPSEVEKTEELLELYGMDKTYIALKKAGLHGFKNLPNIIKHISKDGVFILESELQTTQDERFEKSIGRLN